ncbi:hypothetical protein JTE90_008523 [Oedothorax gibbosus]|uniref:EGF-like domain-containing protein n=1 Tax=Oedothorax gibbosus TaxID=931172 RepID=A0AAV6VGM8_9ARAC|nr:hypothetical protein JTE90_008523 [Oedothorax gibbosus]
MQKLNIILFIIISTVSCKTVNVLNTTSVPNENDELVHALNTVDSNELLMTRDKLLIQDCGSNGVNCTKDPFENDDFEACPEKYVFFNDMCIECDCGEAPCELDENGTKKDCNCSSTQKIFKGRCLTCVCGELSRLCYFDNKGGKQCVCKAGAADRLGTCTACSCGENSRSCLFNKEGDLVCYCKPRFAQRNDTCYESCKSSHECLNGGVCKSEDGSSSLFCKCPDGFTGGFCEVDMVCEAMRSSCDAMKAVCKRDRTRRYCECRSGQKFNPIFGVCEDICDSTKCNNGFCVVKDLGFNCICKQGYGGALCDEEIDKTRDYYSPYNTIPIIVLGILCFSIVGFSIGALLLKHRNEKLMKLYQQKTQVFSQH